MRRETADIKSHAEPDRLQKGALCPCCGVTLYRKLGKDAARRSVIRPTIFYHIRHRAEEALLVCQNCESVYPTRQAKLANGRSAYILRDA